MKEFGIGGAERLLLELNARMEGVEFLPTAVVDEPRDLVPMLDAAGLAHFSLKAKGPGDVRWVGRLRQLIRSEEPDLVHAQNPYPASGARAALVGLKTPLVYTEHNVWPSFHPATRVANALTFWMNDASIVVSDGVRDSIVRTRIGRHYRKRLITIRNGVDPDAVRRDSERLSDVSVHAGSFGCVTHLNHSKAPDVLLEAVAILRERQVRAHCYVVGGGVLEAEVERWRNERNLEHVHLLGARPDARFIMGQLDVFVIASRFEGMPMVLLEALSLGVPIVTTPAGGIGEVVTDRETALIVPIDAPEALADAILELLQDRDLAMKLARNGRSLVDREFHIDMTASDLRAVYDQALS